MRLSWREYWSGLPSPFPGESSWPRGWTLIFCISCISRWILYHCTTWEAPSTSTCLKINLIQGSQSLGHSLDTWDVVVSIELSKITWHGLLFPAQGIHSQSSFFVIFYMTAFFTLLRWFMGIKTHLFNSSRLWNYTASQEGKQIKEYFSLFPMTFEWYLWLADIMLSHWLIPSSMTLQSWGGWHLTFWTVIQSEIELNTAPPISPLKNISTWPSRQLMWV